MKLAQFVQMLRLCFVLAVTGFAVGCDSGGSAPRDASKDAEVGKARAQSTKDFHNQLKESAKGR